MNNSDSIHNNKRPGVDHLTSSLLPRKKHRFAVVNTASVYIKPLGIPLISTATSSSCESIGLEPYRPCTIGRNSRRCEFVFEDRRISSRHCQILFDALKRRVYIVDGAFSFGSGECSRVRVSLNGLFVNGVRIGRGQVRELCAGDEALLVCGNESPCSLGIRIGFVVERIVVVEEIAYGTASRFQQNGLSLDYAMCNSKRGGPFAKANLLLSRCREILSSDDPISYICGYFNSYYKKEKSNLSGFMLNNSRFEAGSAWVQKSDGQVLKKEMLLREDLAAEQILGRQRADIGQFRSVMCHRYTPVGAEVSHAPVYDCVCDDQLRQVDDIGSPLEKGVANDKPKSLYLDTVARESASKSNGVQHHKKCGSLIPPPGNKFYLNRLHYMGQGSLDHHSVITLPELLYPVENLSRIFVATFTSDILWFLSYCEVPHHLPITIACHNTQRCWSSSPDKRMSVPYSDFPNLVVVYPPFPDIVAFGKDRKKLGVACHHPKLFVLQREDTIRVIITSANLVAKQWNNVTNTVWWQDFPRTSVPDYLSLFVQTSDEEPNQDSKSDFAAQLAGFMASLLVDVPSQAYWIPELAKYDFKGAAGHLVASVPGIYSCRAPSILELMHVMPGIQSESGSSDEKFLGSVQASIVGLSHLFCTSVDSNGARVKKLAAFLGKCSNNGYGMAQIVLKRSITIPADVNAVSILVPDPENFAGGDRIQLGFLPRNVAIWVAPLWDIGFFRFYGYIYPKEVLTTVIEGSNSKVQLIIYVSQGTRFSDIPEIMQPEHVSAMCSLVASVQRCTGLWRLKEVLGQYKWPEYLETDFIYGSSSIGSVNPQFLAAFSAAAGKKSLQFPESEESDPDWGCWSASQESRRPSIKIIFPTIETVKNSSCGVLASKRILCFSQRAWQRMRSVDILHDAIPYPRDRIGHPMHIKVARRRFQSRTDESSFGWVYCGSHNFSAAAWGRPILNSLGMKNDGVMKTNFVLGSRLHICNYELGIIFVVPPSEMKDNACRNGANLDEITLPFVVPAPKYRNGDKPATAQAMGELLAELSKQEREKLEEGVTAGELLEVDIPDEEEEILDVPDYTTLEKEDEKAYADILWSQVNSPNSC